jgi:hypothetical protein
MAAQLTPGHLSTGHVRKRSRSQSNSTSPYAQALRMIAVAVMAVHGVIHAMGTVLLWEIAEPGALRYSDAVPTPGSALGYVCGALWAVAGIGFCAAAFRLATMRSAMVLSASSAVLSAAMISMMVADAPVGFFVSLAVLAICTGMAVRSR